MLTNSAPFYVLFDALAVDTGSSEPAPNRKARRAANSAKASPKSAPKSGKAKAGKAKRKSAKSGDADGEDADEDGEEKPSKSIIKRKYRERYKPHDMTCGDNWAAKFSDAVTMLDDAGELKISPALLRDFAKANDCWVPAYRSLNVGMQRMNIGNRLRAKIRKGHEPVFPPKPDVHAE